MNLKNLEEEKLQLEIKELKRHWLKNPQYLQILLPTTLAIFSLLYAITSGLFSSKQELLELNKRQLETDIVNFQKEKNTLLETNNSLKKQIGFYNDSLQNKNLILKKYENSFTKERQKIQSLNQELTSLKNTRNNYIQQITQLEKDFNSKKQKYLKEIESKYYQEIDYQKKSQEQSRTIDGLNNKIAEYKHSISLLESTPFIPKAKQNEFRIWYSEKMIEYYNTLGQKYTLEVERIEKNLERLRKSNDTLKVKTKLIRIQ